MSPEPRQEPSNTLSTANINVDIINPNESDSDDEEIGNAMYTPLPQVPMEEEEESDEEDFRWNIAETQQPLQASEPGSSVPQETIELWSSSNVKSNIEMDADKINQVKSAMASFTLPSTAVPEWANNISEDQWKEQLIQRIKEMQQEKKV